MRAALPASSARDFSRWFWPVVIALLCLQSLLAIDAARRWTPTHDEYWHLPLGLWGWRTGELAVDPINPPLVRLWAAIPLLIGGAALDVPEAARASLTAYDVGDAFLTSNGAGTWRWFFLGRLMLIPGLFAGGLALAWWARLWWGPAAGLIAAVLWLGCPNLLANGLIVAHDFPVTLAILLTFIALIRCHQRPTWSRCLCLGLMLGLAQLCKFSAVVLIGVCPLVWMLLDPAAVMSSLSPDRRRATLRQAGLRVLAMSGVVWLVVQFGYGDLALWQRPWTLSGLLLPPAYLDGWAALSAVMQTAHPVYLDGEWRATGGFRDFYVRALLDKLPPGTLLIIAAAGVGFWRLRRDPVERRRALILLLLISTWLIPASLSGNQLGLRYVLPALPFLLLWAASAGRDLAGTARKDAGKNATVPRWQLAIIPVVLTVPLSLRYHPHHLAYFNELAGGPDAGWGHLIDSSLDWGQDLRELNQLLDDRQIELTGLAYFGTVSPSALGINYRFPPSRLPQPGVYAISANYLAGRPHHLRDINGLEMVAGIDEFGYFRFFEPRQIIGHTIYVYELTADDVARYRAALQEASLN